MDDEQRFLLDLNGYLHLRGVLEPDHLQRLPTETQPNTR